MILRAFGRLGIRVPGACSIIGFDDLPELCKADQPLTTIDMKLKHLGERILGVLEHAGGSKAFVHFSELIDPKLVIRESCASPAKPAIARDAHQTVRQTSA